MSNLAKKLIKSVREGIAIVNGELDPSTYRIITPEYFAKRQKAAGKRATNVKKKKRVGKRRGR